MIVVLALFVNRLVIETLGSVSQKERKDSEKIAPKTTSLIANSPFVPEPPLLPLNIFVVRPAKNQKIIALQAIAVCW